MRLIDPHTVFLLTGVMSGLMALVLLSIKRSYPVSIKGLNEWSLSLVVLFFGGVLASISASLSEGVVAVVPNLLIWTGTYLAYMGSQRFFGVTPNYKPWAALILAATAFAFWYGVVEPSYVMRLRASNVLMTCLVAVHAWLIYKQGLRSFAKVLAKATLTFIAVAQVMRFVTTFIYPVGPNIGDVRPEHLIFVTSFAFSILLISISMILMATDKLRTELEHLASHDSLTNALTRRHMNEACEQELQRCRRNGRSMAVLVMDLDHFKAINDTHGHQAGDQVLVNFVSKVNRLLRQMDQLARFGGEEFVALLPETSLDEAVLVANRIRAISTVSDQGPSCSVSIGVTTNLANNDTVDSLLARADRAMYRAKANGRNRVEMG